MISLALWKILFISLLMTPPCAMTFLIFLPDRQQPVSSFQILTKSQTGQALGICLLTLRNTTPSITLSKRTTPQTLPSTFSIILSNKFSHSNYWTSISAMISRGQATFQSWPPKPVADTPSSVVQSPSLAHLNSDPPTRLSSAA